MSSSLCKNHRGSPKLTLLNLLGVLNVLNVLHVLNMPMDASFDRCPAGPCFFFFFFVGRSATYFSAYCMTKRDGVVYYGLGCFPFGLKRHVNSVKDEERLTFEGDSTDPSRWDYGLYFCGREKNCGI